jgi:predicted alpha/beta superfamily hydrolase
MNRRRAVLALACLALAAPLAAPLDAQLTIRLTAPPDTPRDAAVHVAGSFNGWNPGDAAYRLAPTDAGAYTITLPSAIRGAIEFKFTLGAWETVETTATGGDVPNRAFVVPATGTATFVGTVARWQTPGAARAPKRSTRTSSVTVLSDSFAMPQLGRTRRVWLYLPPGYASSTTRYPVIYMHDGQNVFDEATGFAGEWGVDETLDSLHARGDRGAIVVAVDHGGSRRLDEYDPWVAPNRQYGGGEGDAYVEFLVRTLKPYIDAHYRTRRDASSTAIAGSSMGGLISLYAALKYPDVFGRAAVFSCACWIADPPLYAFARRARPGRTVPRLYFVSGALETATGGPGIDQRRVVDTLAAAGFRRTAMRALVRDDGKHAEWFWRREFPAAYRWLFADAADQPPSVRPKPARR